MWTYSGNPSSSPLDEVRFLIGDVDSTKPLIADEEINYNLAMVSDPQNPQSSKFLSAAYCADAIAARSARSVDKSVGDLSLSYSQQAKAFKDMAQSLRNRATWLGVPIYAGGISRTDKAANYQEPDTVQAGIKIDGMSVVDPSNRTDGTEGA